MNKSVVDSCCVTEIIQFIMRILKVHESHLEINKNIRFVLYGASVFLLYDRGEQSNCYKCE